MASRPDAFALAPARLTPGVRHGASKAHGGILATSALVERHVLKRDRAPGRAQAQTEEGRRAVPAKFHVEGDGGQRLPQNVKFCGPGVADGAGFEIEFGRRIHEVVERRAAFASNIVDQIDDVDEAQFARDLGDVFGEDLLACFR